MTFEELRASARKNAAEIDKQTGAQRLGTSVRNYETAQKQTAASMPRKKGGDTAVVSKTATTAAKKKAGGVDTGRNTGLPPARPSSASLQEQQRQAAADLDTDTLRQLNLLAKDIREADKKQTFGDRASDTLSAILSGYGGTVVNTVGTVSNLFQDPDTDRRSAARAQEALRTGRTSDGKVISGAQRKTLEEAVSRLSDRAAKREAPDSFTNRTYRAADRMQDDSARFQQSAKAGLGGVGSTVVDAAISTGQSLLDNAVGAVTGTGLLPFAARAFGGAAQEARRGGGDLDDQLLYGSAQAAKEFVTEKLFGLAAPQRLTGGGVRSFDDTIEKGIRNVTERLAKTPGGQKFLGGLMTWLAGGATEALEEGIGSVIENTLINPNLRDWDPDTRTGQQKFEDGLYDMLVGGVSGLMGVTNLGAYNVSPAVRAQYAANQAETGSGARAEAGGGTDTAQQVNAARTAQKSPESIILDAVAAGEEQGKRVVRETLELMQGAAGMETGGTRREANPQTEAGPVRAGRVTTIQRPYSGTRPVQTQKNTAPVQVAVDSVRRAQNRIEGARALADGPMGAGQGFKSILKKSLQDVFRSAKGVEVEGVTFDGQPYKVNVGNKVLGKVLGDKNFSAEKIALLDILPEVIRKGEYVGSGEYVQHGKKQKDTVRFDYFETPVSIDGKSYIAKFDVEAFPSESNFRTYEVVKMELSPAAHTDVGPVPTALTAETAPVEGTSALNVDSTITQGTENVNPSGGDGVGAADAGSLNSDYDRLQAQSAQFHPEGAGAARPVDVPKTDFAGRNVSKAASTVMGAKAIPDGVIPMIEQMVAEGRMSYDRVSDAASTARARARIQEIGFQGALAEYREAVRSGKASKDIRTLGATLLNNAANAGDGNAVAELLMLYRADSTNVAQAQQAGSILRKMSPESQLYGIQRTISELNKSNEGKTRGDITISQDLIQKFLNQTDQEGRDAVMEEILQDAANQLPGSWREIFDSMRYLSMLFNPRTHIRNLAGNTIFQIPASLKNRVGAALELGAKSAGANIERTKSLSGANPFGTLAREARADWKNAKPFLEGGHYNEGKLTASDIQKLASPFKNVKHMQWAATLLENTLGRLSNLNMNALEAEDAIFKKFIYSQSLAGYLQANGVKSISEADPALLNRARDYAAQEALRNTFNDKNVVSDAVSSIGKLRNSENQVLRGLSYFTEGALPFKRTPANVAVRAVEYSPAGGIAEIFKTVYDGAVGKATAESVSKRIDRIAAGVSGTALFSLGWLLAAAGYLRGGGDDDEDQRNFDDLTGHQKYALELDNGTSITLDWTAPSAIPLFMGVEASKAMEDGKLTPDDALALLKNMSEPMLQMSMLQGINDLFESAAYAKDRDENVMAALATQAAFGYLSQAVPTVGGQLERIGEDRRMTTYAEKDAPISKDLQYFLGKTSQKIPGADYKQIPYLDAWGREEETGEPVERIFNNFFNPAYVSQVKVDQVERELQRVRDATGDGKVFPSRAKQYFPVKGVQKNLTAEEYQTYAKKRGQTSLEVLRSMMDSPGYQKLSDEKKAEAIADVYSYADAMGKMAVSDYRPGDGTIADKAMKTMLPPADCILYEMNKDRDGDGKVTNLESTQTLQELPGLSGEDRGKAWTAMNEKSKPAKNPFTGVLAEQGMTPEEAAFVWSIYDKKGTKEDSYTKPEKKRDVQKELDLSTSEVNRLWGLIEKAMKG